MSALTKAARTVSAWATPARRRWLYRVVSAVIVAAGAYGIVSDVEAPVLLALAGALLGNQVARANVPRDDGETA